MSWNKANLCLDNYDLLQYLVLSNMGQFAAKISLKLKVAPRSNIALLIKIQWVSKLLLTNGLLLSFIHSDSIDKIFVLTGAIICSALEKKNRYSMHHLILTKIIEGKSQNPLGDSITIRDRSSITNCSTFSYLFIKMSMIFHKGRNLTFFSPLGTISEGLKGSHF